MTTTTSVIFFTIFVSTIKDNKMANITEGLNVVSILKEIRNRVEYGTYSTTTGIENDIEWLKEMIPELGYTLQVRAKARITDLSNMLDKMLYKAQMNKNTQEIKPSTKSHKDLQMEAIMLFNSDKRFTITE